MVYFEAVAWNAHGQDARVTVDGQDARVGVRVLKGIRCTSLQ
jgi:hypothetical protein